MKYSIKNIDIETSTVEEMKEDTFKNIDILKELATELETLRLGNTSTSTKSNQLKEINENIIDKIEENDDENSILEEINYYYLQIKDFNFDNSQEYLEKLTKELPSRKKTNYQEIILGINTFLMKDINEINTFLEEEKDNLSINELEEFKQDILEIKQKINAILYLSKVELSSPKQLEEKLNNIVFLETTSGNIYTLDDLDNNKVPLDFYEGFSELIHSIEDGIFKNAKFLTSGNQKTAGICEVKGFKKRVIYDRVGFDTYAILGAFIKKSDKDKGYIDQLGNRIAIYRKNKDSIIKRINEEEGYLDSQKDILNQIYEFLEPNIKKRG